MVVLGTNPPAVGAGSGAGSGALVDIFLDGMEVMGSKAVVL